MTELLVQMGTRGAVEVLGGILTMFVGFNIGSVVEYYKNYNLYDLEKDKVLALVATVEKLLGHAQGAVAGEVAQVAKKI